MPIPPPPTAHAPIRRLYGRPPTRLPSRAGRVSPEEEKQNQLVSASMFSSSLYDFSTAELTSSHFVGSQNAGFGVVQARNQHSIQAPIIWPPESDKIQSAINF